MEKAGGRCERILEDHTRCRRAGHASLVAISGPATRLVSIMHLVACFPAGGHIDHRPTSCHCSSRRETPYDGARGRVRIQGSLRRSWRCILIRPNVTGHIAIARSLTLTREVT